MVVHRVAQWLNGFLSALNPRRRAAQAAPTRVLVGATAGARPIAASALGASPAVPHWLAASRRLRPPRAISIPSSQATPPPAASAETGRDHVAAGRPRPQPPVSDVPKRVEAAPAPPPAAPKSQPLRREPPISKPRVNPQQPAASASSERDEYVQRRRLAALKHLVRMGVYNEGFKRSETPEQYAQSLGLNDDLGGDIGDIQ